MLFRLCRLLSVNSSLKSPKIIWQSLFLFCAAFRKLLSIEEKILFELTSSSFFIFSFLELNQINDSELCHCSLRKPAVDYIHEMPLWKVSPKMKLILYSTCECNHDDQERAISWCRTHWWSAPEEAHIYEASTLRMVKYATGCVCENIFTYSKLIGFYTSSLFSFYCSWYQGEALLNSINL